MTIADWRADCAECGAHQKLEPKLRYWYLVGVNEFEDGSVVDVDWAEAKEGDVVRSSGGCFRCFCKSLVLVPVRK